MSTSAMTRLKTLVHFREFPFGMAPAPSMREFMASEPWEHQAEVVAYLRSGHVLGYVMGGGVPDWFDPTCRRANPIVDGKVEDGATPMTDGVWFWPAALIYFVEKYNVRLPQEFIEHAARNGWRVDREAVARGVYDYDF
ncbi:MAG TPA: hypothetical protein VFW33_21255 [Gemmataceae bacterium]|nr:hypothetical protein [Gemmataceae bacterium]